METHFFKRKNWWLFGLGDISWSQRSAFLSFGGYTFRWGKSGGTCGKRWRFDIAKFNYGKREFSVGLMPCHMFCFGYGNSWGKSFMVGPVVFSMLPIIGAG